MSELASKRWAERGRTEAEMREYFQTAPLDAILEEFSTMRRHYEMAGTILNQRVQKERNVEACANCGRGFSKDVPWFNREVVKDPETGIITNIFSCSQACFIALKRKENNPRLVRKQ